MVAGLGAYLISINEASPGVNLDSPQALKDHIIELSYARGDNNALNVIYNGMRPWEAGGVDGPVRHVLAYVSISRR